MFGERRYVTPPVPAYWRAYAAPLAKLRTWNEHLLIRRDDVDSLAGDG
jgi:hypothetical protein